MAAKRWTQQTRKAWLVAAGCLALPSCGWSESFFGCDDDATCEPAVTSDTAGATGTAGASGSGDMGGSGGAADGAGGGTNTGDACVDQPPDGEVLNEEHCGIWVSSSLGDDIHPGTRDLPVKTLAKAIELAGADSGPGHVYACAEAYPEAVTLAEVSLFGGFQCSAPGWPYLVNEAKRAEIHAPPALGALVLLKSAAESKIHDFNVIASDAAAPGGSSIAVFALAGSRASFRRAYVLAGNGADGLDGEDGSHDGQPAPQGLYGADGTAACLLEVGLGASSVAKACPDGTQSTGGAGGDANAVFATGGSQGLEAPNPNPQGYGAGGKGESAAQGTTCTPGIGGAHGTDGPDGAGGVTFGRLTGVGILGSAGADGGPALPGQGGGGGGASLGSPCAAAGVPAKGGAGGGSGGSGGCGGQGGKGGQAGGASLGFALLSNNILATEIVIQAGMGGNGGHGGLRQSGGKGGLPGYGGIGFGGANGAQDGCSGGVGGYGGNGGAGGGGRGGAATPVGALVDIDLETTECIQILGKRGLGGLGGNPGENDGDDGQAGALATFDP